MLRIGSLFRPAVVLAGVVVFLSLGTERPAARSPFSGIVVFGDSLSDTGNAFAAIKTSATPPDYSMGPLLIPGAPYARGGHHFTNGATWVEYLARPLELSRSVEPVLQSSNPHAANYALGTARARAEGVFHLQAQVSAFLADSGGVAPADALYVIQIAGNDLRDALAAFPAGHQPILADALQAIANAVTTLYAAGARHVLVWNVPDIGLTPAVRLLGALTAGIATDLTEGFNENLAIVLGSLALPGLVTFDADALISDIAANPGTYGLTNVISPCVTPHVQPFACQNPGEYLFWDGVHPTTAVHAIVAEAVAAQLGV